MKNSYWLSLWHVSSTTDAVAYSPQNRRPLIHITGCWLHCCEQLIHEIFIRHCDWWVIQVIYENCVPYNLIGLFYYIIFICAVEHTSEALHACGWLDGAFLCVFTIYEFGHAFNCGSVRKNEDKFVAGTTWAKWWLESSATHKNSDESFLWWCVWHRWIRINEFCSRRASFLTRRAINEKKRVLMMNKATTTKPPMQQLIYYSEQRPCRDDI